MLSLDPGGVIFEVKQGPYAPFKDPRTTPTTARYRNAESGQHWTNGLSVSRLECRGRDALVAFSAWSLFSPVAALDLPGLADLVLLFHHGTALLAFVVPGFLLVLGFALFARHAVVLRC
jgi:hypothetical protein